MIYLAVVCLLLVILVAWERRQNIQREAEWARERQLLISRIQHPEIFVPDPEQPTIEVPINEEADEIGLVGTIIGGEDGS